MKKRIWIISMHCRWHSYITLWFQVTFCLITVIILLGPYCKIRIIAPPIPHQQWRKRLGGHVPSSPAGNRASLLQSHWALKRGHTCLVNMPLSLRAQGEPSLVPLWRVMPSLQSGQSPQLFRHNMQPTSVPLPNSPHPDSHLHPSILTQLPPRPPLGGTFCALPNASFISHAPSLLTCHLLFALFPLCCLWGHIVFCTLYPLQTHVCFPSHSCHGH